MSKDTKREVEQAATDEELIEDVADAVIVPPDGGWGWVIMLASFACNIVVDGIIFTAGQAFQPAWEVHYNVSSGTAAWAVSLLSGCYLIVGPLVSALVNIFGGRKTVFAGTVIASVGFALSMFAPNIVILFLTFGVLGGIGFGLIFLPSIVVVGYYFNKKRAFATGIAVCGSGIGTFVMAPLTNFLMDEFVHWQNVMLLLTGIVLNCLVFGALFRPLEPTRRQIDKFADEGGLDDGVTVFDEINELKKRHMGTSTDSIRSRERVRMPARQLSNGDATELTPTGSKGRQRATSEFVKSAMDRQISAEHNGHRQRQISLFVTPSGAGHDSQENLDREVLREMSRQSLQALNRPLSRQDIFYPGSVKNLREFKSQPSVSHYIASTLNVNAVPDVTAADGVVTGAAVPTGSALKATLRAMLDLSILKSPSFLILAFGGFFTLTGFYVPFIYLPPLSKSKGHSKEQATMLIQILGITNIVGRVFCGWLSDRPNMNALMINNVALVFGGLATIVVPHLDAYWMLVVYCVIFGFGTACFAALRSIICVDLLGLEKLTNAFGLCLLFMGVASLVGSPIAGFLKDATGNYAMSFYVTGALVMVSGLIGFPLRAVNRWEKRRLGIVSVVDEEIENEIEIKVTDEHEAERAHNQRITETVLEEDEEDDTRT